MFAWVIALGLLWNADTPALRTAIPSATLLVYLQTGPAQPAAPVEHMKRELGALMQASGYHVIWGDARAPGSSAESASLVVLELRGGCGMPPGNYRGERYVASGASLAETSMDAGSVQPFSWIDCANLTRMIGPALAGEPGALRDYLYGRAMARVAAHELYHVVMGNSGHGHEGVTKPRFTVPDLLDEDFTFDAAARSKLRQRALENSGAGETVVGR